MSNAPLSEQWAQAAHKWVELDSAASLMEDSKSSVLSQMMMRCPEKSVAAKEMFVKAGAEWTNYIQKMHAARKAANVAKVEMDFLKMRFSEWTSAEANNRAGARL